MKKIIIIAPDDFHVHLRDEESLNFTVKSTSKQFNRALVMPNLKIPITTIKDAINYRNRILRKIPKKYNFFNPLMTLYLVKDSSLEDLKNISNYKFIIGYKLYFLGSTTNSNFGIKNLKSIYSFLERMQYRKVPLLIHGEMINDSIDIFDREKYFIEDILIPLRKKFPELKIVLEHISTKEAVDYIISSDSKYLAGTITAHHLLSNRNIIFNNGINPNYYCAPILKSEFHRKSLVKAATSGSSNFFLGTDSAPHSIKKKRNFGCAGIYTSENAISYYAEVFYKENKIRNLEKFSSINGSVFYNLNKNSKKLYLEKRKIKIPESFKYLNSKIIPFMNGTVLNWRVNYIK